MINKVCPVVCIGSFLKGAKISILPFKWCSVPSVFALLLCLCLPLPCVCLTYSALGRALKAAISGCWSEGCTCCCQKEWFSVVLSVAGSVDAWQSLGDVRLITLLDLFLLVLQKWVSCLR